MYMYVNPGLPIIVFCT